MTSYWTQDGDNSLLGVCTPPKFFVDRNPSKYPEGTRSPAARASRAGGLGDWTPVLLTRESSVLEGGLLRRDIATDEKCSVESIAREDARIGEGGFVVYMAE